MAQIAIFFTDNSGTYQSTRYHGGGSFLAGTVGDWTRETARDHKAETGNGDEWNQAQL